MLRGQAKPGREDIWRLSIKRRATFKKPLGGSPTLAPVCAGGWLAPSMGPTGPTDALLLGLISLPEGNQGPAAGTFSGTELVDDSDGRHWKRARAR